MGQFEINLGRKAHIDRRAALPSVIPYETARPMRKRNASATLRIATQEQVLMSPIISLFNHKGGVSKTTTAFNLGWSMADRGKKVLVVDGDPQCNLTG